MIEPSEVASYVQDLITWDLKTCAVSDLTFTETVRLTSTINGEIHGITTSFDCDMMAGENVKFKNVLRTSPYSTPTHWKQCSFLFDDKVKVSVGSVIKGTITIERRKSNERELEVTLNLFKDKTVICNQKYSVS